MCSSPLSDVFLVNICSSSRNRWGSLSLLRFEKDYFWILLDPINLILFYVYCCCKEWRNFLYVPPRARDVFLDLHLQSLGHNGVSVCMCCIVRVHIRFSYGNPISTGQFIGRSILSSLTCGCPVWYHRRPLCSNDQSAYLCPVTLGPDTRALSEGPASSSVCLPALSSFFRVSLNNIGPQSV